MIFAKVSNVPFLVRACDVVEPSKLIEALATLLESDESVMTSLSPGSMVTSVVCNAPPLVIFPCVWEAGVMPVMVTSVMPVTWPVESVVICGTLVALPLAVCAV